ncbi:MAG TPA: PAS domain S-box protein [Candidatus Saccharimonadia bacterium]|jgi:PAS domain S-box-containing protein
MKADLPPKILGYIERLESDHSEALVAAFDRNGYYLYASPNHEAVIGFTAEELTSMHLSQTIEKSQHHAAWVLRTISVLYPEPLRFSTRLVAKSGAIIPISGTLRHLRDTGGDRYFISCANPAPKP